MTADSTIELRRNKKIKSTGILKKRAVLLVLSENLLGGSLVLDAKSTLIGRGSDCDFTISDPLVSKKHCRIYLNDENIFYIEDAGSTNSTYLNGKKLEKPAHISYGDRIVIGNTIIRFFMAENLDI
ncbi:MAG: FHA domain-containing protein [Spirochaetes bacterium]|nr:FHA domain-containing protein [Spirochaetota bacterium]